MTTRVHFRDVALVLTAAAALRLALFSGFVLGDDAAYAQLAKVVLNAEYPPVVDLNVFATRPVLLGAIAASIGLFGWNELAFVLPVLLASLAGIASAYALGVLVFDRRAGLFAALTIALLPLDAVHATTMANDIVASSLAGLGAAIAVAAIHVNRTSQARLAGAGGGLLIGLSAGVKLSAFALGLPLLVVLGVLWVRGSVSRDRLIAIGTGWMLANFALALFFRVQSGRWLAHFAVEWAFNSRHMVAHYADTAAEALLSYPRWMSGLAPIGPINHPFFPFGLFFPMGIVALVVALRLHGRRSWFLAVWIGVLFLFLQFWPMQLAPRYAPIHRLPRFLHPLVLPFATAIGVTMAEALRRSAGIRAIAVAGWGAFAVTSGIGAYAASARHRDVMIDQRVAAAVTGSYPGRVAADPELLNYLRFRGGFENGDRFLALTPSRLSVPERTLVITGGSRRIDLDPAYVKDYAPPAIPADWYRIAVLPGAPRPWRLLPGEVYLSGPAETRWHGPPDLSRACADDVDWELRDLLDVGDDDSERQHAYAISRETWRGVRTLPAGTDGPWRDDGRAFHGWQQFELRELIPGRQVCLAILIDPRVAAQQTRWFAGGTPLGSVRSPAETGEAWGVKTLLVPGGSITSGSLLLREEFVASPADVNSFLVAAYQPGAARQRD